MEMELERERGRESIYVIIKILQTLQYNNQCQMLVRYVSPLCSTKPIA